MPQLADVIDLKSILDTASGNDLVWNRFLTELTRQLDCDSSVLLVTDQVKRKNTHFLFSVNIPPEYQEKYENELNRLDSFNYFLSKNSKTVHYSQTLVDTACTKTDASFKPLAGQKYQFGLSIPCNNNHSLNLILSRELAFSDAEQQQFSKILQSLPAMESEREGW
ncbi:hypothetical protein [Bathymodiolus platifrons methanotrophic gill symbiont]|uniref:hypothetical protein n=1 Tax=Bathymodiolus platifrons methanotrophic gill symbiont TaxID=113268 RepID=UPI001C8D5244|nr:hypothetical protein [Bathymodiolus platifrons methanotrophic gill symbiont]